MHQMKGKLGGLGQKSAQLNNMKIDAPAFGHAPAFAPPPIKAAPAFNLREWTDEDGDSSVEADNKSIFAR